MASRVLKVATCQFAVSKSIGQNARRITGFLHQAGRVDADMVHFSECALSGYAGVDFETLESFNQQLLREETEKIISLAADLGLWVILGSTHRLTGPNKPHNSLYLINPDGKIVGRYDKRFCTPSDLRHYTPGDRFVHFEINGVLCTLLICFDLRFPEIYRQLRREGVDCIFQSFYNARQKGTSIHTHIMRQTMQCRAATNYFWISMANSSGYYSPYPSCFIQPDGKIVNSLKQNKAGLMVNTVDVNEIFYDPSEEFRNSAMEGKLTNGPGTIDDVRSKDTTIL